MDKYTKPIWMPVNNMPGYLKDGRFVLLRGGCTDEYGCDDDCRPVTAKWHDDGYGAFWAVAYWDDGWRTSYFNPKEYMEIPK